MTTDQLGTIFCERAIVHNLSQAISAYASPGSAIQTERGTELQAFEHVTRKISRACIRDDFNSLIAALHENRKLWTALAVDVADPGNKLPAPLRAKIFYLAEFVDQHTSRVLRKTADTSILCDVNQSVIRGLRGMEGKK